MATIKAPLLKILNRTYEPSTHTDVAFGRYDISIISDDKGRPILFFIGSRLQNGKIKGERYARRLVLDQNGNITRDHWDLKGKVSGK